MIEIKFCLEEGTLYLNGSLFCERGEKPPEETASPEGVQGESEPTAGSRGQRAEYLKELGVDQDELSTLVLLMQWFFDKGENLKPEEIGPFLDLFRLETQVSDIGDFALLLEDGNAL